MGQVLEAERELRGPGIRETKARGQHSGDRECTEGGGVAGRGEVAPQGAEFVNIGALTNTQQKYLELA